jgi:phytanoyl-CoA hydroxylase
MSGIAEVDFVGMNPDPFGPQPPSKISTERGGEPLNKNQPHCRIHTKRGIMIDDVDMENGPMMVVPGSHKGPIHDHHGHGRFCGAMDPENCDIDLSRAVPCLGKAGSITIHHVRTVHGSATNFSGRSLLYQYRAADAWPLLGLKEGIEKFNEQLIVGEPSLAPRLVPLPVRMPLPPAEHQGSIYENQRAGGRRYFATPDQAPRIAAE